MDGLLILDKPQGLTSHDVVARVRRLFRIKRIGHAGTLDPMATGVLVLCVGQATRLSEYLLGENKAYEGVIKLGERTNTDDAEGEVIATRPVSPITDDDLRRLERQFTGEIEQMPPQFSAIHKGGQRAYALARKGETVELEPRRVVVHELQLETQDARRKMQDRLASCVLRLFVKCSAGTYIRAMARDIGEALGCGGHLVALRRTQAGRFMLNDAITLEELERVAKEEHLHSLLLPMDRAVADWPEVQLNDDQVRKLKMGQVIPLTDAEAAAGGLDSPQIPANPTGRLRAASTSDWSPAVEGKLMRVYDSRRAFIAVARWDGTKLAPVKVFDAAPSLVQ